MIACTSPALTERSITRKISRPSVSRACRSLISSITTLFRQIYPHDRSTSGLLFLQGKDRTPSSDAAFEAHRQQLLRFDREFHRQLFQHFLAEAVDDQRHRVLGAEPALPAIEQLVLADLRGRRLVLDPGRGIAHLDIGHSVRAAPVTNQQRVALRVVARALRPRLHAHETAIGVLSAAGRYAL